jgi:hypothetical protein
MKILSSRKLIIQKNAQDNSDLVYIFSTKYPEKILCEIFYTWEQMDDENEFVVFFNAGDTDYSKLKNLLNKEGISYSDSSSPGNGYYRIGIDFGYLEFIN